MRLALEVVAVVLAVVVVVLWCLPPRQQDPPRLSANWTPRCAEGPVEWFTVEHVGNGGWNPQPMDVQADAFIVQSGNFKTSTRLHRLGFEGSHAIGPVLPGKTRSIERRGDVLWLALGEGNSIQLLGVDPLTLDVVLRAEPAIPEVQSLVVVQLLIGLTDGRLGVVCALHPIGKGGASAIGVLPFDIEQHRFGEIRRLTEGSGHARYDEDSGILAITSEIPDKLRGFNCRTWEEVPADELPAVLRDNHFPDVMPSAILTGPRGFTNHRVVRGPWPLAVITHLRRALWILIAGPVRTAELMGQHYRVAGLQAGGYLAESEEKWAMEDPDLLATIDVAKHVMLSFANPTALAAGPGMRIIRPLEDLRVKCFKTTPDQTLVVQTVLGTPSTINGGSPILRFDLLSPAGTAIEWKRWIPLSRDIDPAELSDIWLQPLADGRWLILDRLTVLNQGGTLSYAVVEPLAGITLDQDAFAWGRNLRAEFDLD